MTDAELVDLALKVHLGALTFSLAAMYAVFSDKFIEPMIERAEDLCGSTRGKLTTDLMDVLRPLLETPRNLRVVDVKLLDQTGTPLEPADVREVPTLDSEEFRNKVATFLDRDSDRLDVYWLALDCKQRLLTAWNHTRFATAFGPLFSGSAVGVFGAWSRDMMSMPSRFWIYAVGVTALLPLVVLVAYCPIFAYHSNCLNRLRR